MANTLSQSGAQSATFTVAVVNTGTIEAPIYVNGTLTVTDWATLPEGKLKSLLNKAYGAFNTDPVPVFVPNFDLFFAAAGTAGFSCSMLHSVGGAGHQDGLAVTLDANGYPVIAIETADVGPFIARLQAAYSAAE